MNSNHFFPESKTKQVTETLKPQSGLVGVISGLRHVRMSYHTISWTEDGIRMKASV